MKKNIFKYIGIVVFIIGISSAFAQAPPPPNGGDTGNGGDTPVGGGAPIGSGLVAMMILGSAYGAKKLILNRK